jgi:hypothetical protein
MTKAWRQRPPRVGTWPFDDEILGLRIAGTDRTHELSPGRRTHVLGSDAGCDVVIRDRTASVARRHARLVRQGSHWLIRAIDHAGGELTRDRVALPAFPLVPGIEIGLGRVSLIAESARSRALRVTLSRLIGSTADRGDEVDRALRSVLGAASGLGALTVYGNEDLGAVAQLLHRHTLQGWPFVRWERRTGADPGDALAAAAGGTLCVSAHDLSSGVEAISRGRRRSTTRVQLIVLVPAVRPLRPILAAVADPLILTPLASRKHERARIIDDLAAEAAVALGIAASGLSEADRRIILRFDAATLPAIERATLRIVALRHWKYFARAAKRLGMAHASLIEWAELRGLTATHGRGRPTPDPGPATDDDLGIIARAASARRRD